jgi:CHAT domain-containing protein
MLSLGVASCRNIAMSRKLFQDGVRSALTLDDRRDSIVYLQRALPLWRQIGVVSGEIGLLVSLGDVSNFFGDNGAAIEYLNTAIKLANQANDAVQQEKANTALALTYASMGQPSKAVEILQQVLASSRQRGNAQNEGASLINLCTVYLQTGDANKAIELCSQGVTILRAREDKAATAAAMTDLSAALRDLGQYGKALEYAKEVLTQLRQSGDKGGQATALNNIGAIYDDIGDKKQALEFFNEALPLIRALGDKRAEASTLTNVGKVETDLGRYNEALDSLRLAIPLREATGDDPGLEVTLNNIGQVYSELGQLDSSLEYFDRTLSLATRVGDHQSAARTLANIGDVYYRQDREAQALAKWQEALEATRSNGDVKWEMTTLAKMARLNRKRNNLHEALSQIEKAAEILETLRGDLSDASLRMTYFSSVRMVYDIYIDVLMRLNDEQPTLGYAAKAFDVSERARARSLIELLSETRAKLPADIDHTLLEKESSLRQQIHARREDTLRHASRGGAEANSPGRNLAIDDLQNQLDDVEAQIRRLSPHYASVTQVYPPSLASVQSRLGDDSILLEFFLGEGRGYAWCVTQRSIDSYSIPNPPEAVQLAERFYAAVSSHDSSKSDISPTNRLEVGRRLARLLLGPVAGRLGNKRLVIVADSILNYIPFGALPRSFDSSGSSAYEPLLLDHEIVMVPSAAVLVVDQTRSTGRPLASKTLLAVGDPVFSRSDPRLKSAASSPEPLSDLTVGRVITSQRTSSGTFQFSRLAWTRDEVESIAALVGESKRDVKLDFNANLAAVTNGRLQDYQWVHFATHGFFNGNEPELSGLAFSLVDEHGVEREGLLLLPDVFSLSLNADVVVLSACESGIGKEVEGEGVIGLTRDFLYAGAKSLVVSLWKVDDQATSVLMKEYYQGLLSTKPMKVGEALRAAELDIWKHEQWRDPYYWAAFELQGDWH